VFDVKESVSETLDIICDKAKMKGITVDSMFEGFPEINASKKYLIKTD
jgi:hypothetical protein